MQLPITEEFLEICRRIISEGKSESEWGEIESCDTFQTDSFCGGFEDGVFTFSYYDKHRGEYWFSLALAEINDIADKKITILDMNHAPT